MIDDEQLATPDLAAPKVQNDPTLRMRVRVARGIAAGDCAVCGHPRRERIEHAIFAEQRANDDVARSFGIGDGGSYASEMVRQHRAVCVTDAELAILRAGRGRHRDLTVRLLRAHRSERA